VDTQRRADYGVRLGSDALRIIEENRIMKQLLKNLLNDESGQDLIEYALIAALIALVAITGLNGLASRINSEFTAVGNDI
jgi:pilus assembly protein Flp/PilA